DFKGKYSNKCLVSRADPFRRHLQTSQGDSNRENGQLPPVWCNMGRFNQAFLNILVNAAHAIEGQWEIRIATRAEAESVKITISDSGGGIAPEHVRRIFETRSSLPRNRDNSCFQQLLSIR
ncbi:MAG: ATP-binding protein, partial [Desulfuromonadaceae bacterium]